MKRDISQNLIIWKSSSTRKPLLLQGARQTGKTFILKQFGNSEYKDLHYFNFEAEPFLHDFFKPDLKPDRIIESLSLYKKCTINAESGLIFFDEIQFSNNALNSLKYFCEDAPQYHIVAAGSLLGVKLSQPKSFPVGKVDLLTLYPMHFGEYLSALGEERYRAMVENFRNLEPIPLPFHEELIRLLKEYYFVGGMPEAVSDFALHRNFETVRTIQDAICKTYMHDFAKHTSPAEFPKISLIWDSLPRHLSRENKKFVFSALSKSARAREYENALRWLLEAGLVYMAHGVETVEQPLTAFGDRNSFKIYLLDVGLLGCISRLTSDILVHGNDLFTTFHGALVENYAAQQLVSLGQQLFYWKRENSAAEVDFLYERKNTVYPLEIKAGINPRSKSLRAYAERYSPRKLLRSTLLNARQDGELLNVPLYAIRSIAGVLDHTNAL